MAPLLLKEGDRECSAGTFRCALTWLREDTKASISVELPEVSTPMQQTCSLRSSTLYTEILQQYLDLSVNHSLATEFLAGL